MLKFDVLTGRVWSAGAVAAVTGAAVGIALPVWWPGLLALTLWCMALTVVAWRARRPALCRGAGWIAVVAATAAAAATPRAGPPAVVLAQVPAVHTLVAVEEARASHLGSQVTAAWLGSDRSVPFADPDRHGTVRVLLRTSGAVRAARCGETIRVIGRIEPLAGYANPRAWDPRPDAVRAGLAGVLDAGGAGSIAVIGSNWWSHSPTLALRCALTRPFGAARRHLAAQVRAKLPAWEAGVVNAFALGDTSHLDPGLSAVLRANGTAHIIAVSGSHLTLVVAVLAWLLVRGMAAVAPGLFRRQPRCVWFAVVCVCASWSYAALTGAPASAVRAAFMVSIVAVVRAMSRSHDLVEALGFAVCAMIAFDPDTVCDAGWLLSVAGVIGLMRASVLWPVDVGLRTAATWRDRIRCAGRACLQASVAASLATAPVTVVAFGGLAVTGPLANVVAAPYAGVIALPWCLFATGVAALSEGWVASATAMMTSWALWPLRAVAATSPADWFVWWPVSAAGWTAACGLPLLLWLAPWTRAKIAVVCCLCAAGVAGETWERRRVENATVHAWFFDVGHGDATLLRLADGRTMLIDAGGAAGDGGRTGQLAVAPVLKSMGIDRIDVLVLSHAHPDHGNGLAAIAGSFDIGEFWWTGQGPVSTEIAAAIGHLARRQVRRRSFGPGDPRWVGFGASTVRVLWPQAGAPSFDPLLSLNDNSLVLEVSIGTTRLLLTGDIERAAEARLLAAHAARSATILKMPHHGSLTSSSPEWLVAVSPALAIASARPWARWPLPHAEVRARYAAAGATPWETWRGMVHVRFDADGLAAVQGARSLTLSHAGLQAPGER